MHDRIWFMNDSNTLAETSTVLQHIVVKHSCRSKNDFLYNHMTPAVFQNSKQPFLNKTYGLDFLNKWWFHMMTYFFGTDGLQGVFYNAWTQMQYSVGWSTRLHDEFLRIPNLHVFNAQKTLFFSKRISLQTFERIQLMAIFTTLEVSLRAICDNSTTKLFIYRTTIIEEGFLYNLILVWRHGKRVYKFLSMK